jgi:hypothetical protein
MFLSLMSLIYHKDDPMGDLEKIVKGEGDTGLPKDPPKLDSRENIMGAIDKLKNPRRAGGPLDPVEGITRTLARRILDRKGIEIGKNDPIDVFDETFGEIIVDVKESCRRNDRGRCNGS